MDKKGLTLTELIVATSLVGIILLAIVSTDYALRNQYKAMSTSGISGLSASAVLNHIMGNAVQAVGSVTPDASQTGVLIGPTGALGANTFCIRRPVAAGTSDPLIWTCYSTVTVSGKNYMYNCTPTPAGDCSTASVGYQNLGEITGVTAGFTQNPGAGSQQMVFTSQVTVPDGKGGTLVYSATVSPPMHRL
jgi:prepilin-type N-terminal cleavage/methylation domain-containing protein